MDPGQGNREGKTGRNESISGLFGHDWTPLHVRIEDF